MISHLLYGELRVKIDTNFILGLILILSIVLIDILNQILLVK